MVAPVRLCWCSRPVVSAFNAKAAPPGRWGEACSAGGIRQNDGVVVVRVQQAAWHCWLVIMDACPTFRGGPRRVGVRSESPGSMHAHPLADDLGCRQVHADMVVVPLVALRQIAVHILLAHANCTPFWKRRT